MPRGAFLFLAALSIAAPAWASDWLPAGLSAKKHSHGWTFADAKDMTLYVFDRDEETPGKSNCKGNCAATWPPVMAAADAQAQGPWSLIVRDDGAKQWAFRGKPLYTYSLDAFAGATFGDGVGTVWHVALQPIRTPSEVSVGATVLGQTLRDEKGLTLYTSDDDRNGKSACDWTCLRTWRPVTAPWVANPADEWSIFLRDDGTKQWAYAGKPLYRYAGDINAGEISGEQAGRGWHPAVLEPAPPLPPFVTVRASDAGDLLATEKGFTIYAHGANPRARQIPAGSKCKDADCFGPDWIPLIAAADAKPTGSWALLDLPDGAKQWTYKGQKLYTNVNDTQPGDFKGIRFGGDRGWAAIMRSGLPMQGVTVGG